MPVKLIIFDLDGTLIDSSIDITNAINYAIKPYSIKPLSVDETISLDHYSTHLVDKTTVYPGVRETLERLKDYKKAVISNKREALSTKILDELGLLKYLDMVVGSDTTPERKPSPIPILYVLSKLNIRPEDAVIVGDSNFDIEAGKAAGIKTVAVTYGYRPRELLKDADYLIDKMTELVNILRLIT